MKQKIPEQNEVLLAIWSRDSSGRLREPNTGLKISIENFLATKTVQQVYVTAIDGEIVFFNINAEVILSANRSLSNVSSTVNDNLINHFNSSVVLPGTPLNIARLLQVIQNSNGVDTVNIKEVIGYLLKTFDHGLGNGVDAEVSGYIETLEDQPILPTTFSITAGQQKISDDGNGNLIGDIGIGTNTVDYDTGKYVGTFNTIPTTSDFIEAEARIFADLTKKEDANRTSLSKLDGKTAFAPLLKREPVGFASSVAVNGVLPEANLPYEPRHITFFGGWDADGTQPGGQLVAYDDGNGGIIGDVLPGGIVEYDTGLISFVWNTTPPPNTTITYYGRLLTPPDGTIKEFNFEVRDTIGGGGSQVSLATLSMVGRSQFRLDDLDSTNINYVNAYDNGFGKINGDSLNSRENNTLEYGDVAINSTGTITFNIAPEATAGQDFRIQLAPTTLFMYTSFIAYTHNSDESDYLAVAFIDHRGRVYRDVLESFPFAKVDHLCGRYDFSFNKSFSNNPTISYQSRLQSSDKNLDIDECTMPTFGNVTLTEISTNNNLS